MSGTKVMPHGSFSADVGHKPRTGRGRPRREIRLYGGVQRWPETDSKTGTTSMSAEFAMYVSIHENGRFVRIPMSLPQAQLWLADCLGEVEAELRVQKGGSS